MIEVIKFSASSFRDFHPHRRVRPVDARDILLVNQDARLEALGRFTEDPSALQRAIRQNEGQAFEDVFTHTRAVRRSVIDAKQTSRNT